MKTANAQESINIIGTQDAFYIKDRGTGIVNLNGQLKTFKSMYVDENEITKYFVKNNENSSVQNVTIEEEIETPKLENEIINKFL